EALLEQLWMRAVVSAAGRDVDRNVAEEPDPPLERVALQGAPFALEPDLIGNRVAAGEPLPVLDPPAVALTEVDQLGRADRRPRLSQQPRPRGKRRARLVRRAVAIGRPQRQHLPPRLPSSREPVDEPVRLAPKPPVRERGHMQQDTARARKLGHGAWFTQRPKMDTFKLWRPQ